MGVRRCAEQQQDHEKEFKLSVKYLQLPMRPSTILQSPTLTIRTTMNVTCLSIQLHHCLGGFLQENFRHIGESTYIGRGYEAGCGVGGDWRV